MSNARKTRSADAGKALQDLGRAAGGALIFSLPMLMTAEMWSLGFTMDRLRLLLLLVIALPLLIGLSRRIGFEKVQRWSSSFLDSLLALGVAGVVCSLILYVFGVVGPGMGWDEIVGKIVVQMIPAAIGALLARSQFGTSGEDAPGKEETYVGELFLMGVGALFLGLNVAPTDDVMEISYRMTDVQALILTILSPLLMHGFVFAVAFTGGSELSPDTPWWSAFARFTLPGYAIALLCSFGLLWLFGRLDGMSFDSAVVAVVVLAFPSAIGAAAARLIL
ncbi:TIGR02587 family membrane protein [Pseudochelatococcus sp. B33]